MFTCKMREDIYHAMQYLGNDKSFEMLRGFTRDTLKYNSNKQEIELLTVRGSMKIIKNDYIVKITDNDYFVCDKIVFNKFFEKKEQSFDFLTLPIYGVDVLSLNNNGSKKYYNFIKYLKSFDHCYPIRHYIHDYISLNKTPVPIYLQDKIIGNIYPYDRDAPNTLMIYINKENISLLNTIKFPIIRYNLIVHFDEFDRVIDSKTKIHHLYIDDVYSIK